MQSNKPLIWFYFWEKWYCPEARKLWLLPGEDGNDRKIPDNRRVPICTFQTTMPVEASHRRIKHVYGVDGTVRLDTLLNVIINEWHPDDFACLRHLLSNNMRNAHRSIGGSWRSKAYSTIKRMAPEAHYLQLRPNDLFMKMITWGSDPIDCVCGCNDYFY